jgi:MFS family permease
LLGHEGNAKYIYFVCCFACRMVQGFGNSCINSATSSIIAFNYPDNLSFLMGMQQIFNNAGMLLGPIIGSWINDNFGYTSAFNVNAGLLLTLFIIALIVYPYDPPLLEMEDDGKDADPNAPRPITISTLIRRFNIFSVACCTACALYAFTFKESILTITMENYVGLTPSYCSFIQMVESAMFIGFSLLISLVP